MARKRNCWEVKECGREPAGPKVAELGVCPATTDLSADGLVNFKFLKPGQKYTPSAR